VCFLPPFYFCACRVHRFKVEDARSVGACEVGSIQDDLLLRRGWVIFYMILFLGEVKV
jgi:hypothetical protein